MLERVNLSQPLQFCTIIVVTPASHVSSYIVLCAPRNNRTQYAGSLKLANTQSQLTMPANQRQLPELGKTHNHK